VSWQATAWADSLPYDTLQSYLAYRVLIKLCNNADEHGRTTWRSKKELSVELGVSERSVQRAMRELEQALLILPGDQEYVRHIRADRRPKVYDMNLQYREQTFTPELPIEAPSDGETGLSTGDLRGDNWGLNGETTAVAHRTILEPPTTKTPKVTKTATVSPLVPVGYEPVPGYIPCNGPGPHQYAIGSDDETPCRRCGYIRYQLDRDNRDHQRRREAQAP
jgi:hypothetical protein